MKKLHLYTLKSFIGPFIATFFVALFVLLMQFLWHYLDDLIGKGLSAGLIIQILGLATAAMVPMALPLAVLLSSLMTFGNLGEHNELVAMKAAGISLTKIMKPLTYFAIATTIGAFLFSNYVLPVANLKRRSLLHDIKKQPAEVMIPEGVFYNGIDGYSIRVDKKDKETNMLREILIYNHTENRGNHFVTHADSGTLVFSENRDYLILTLFNGVSYDEKKVQRGKQRYSYPMERYIFEREQLVFDLSGIDMQKSDEDLFKNHYQMLSVDQLDYTIDSLKVEKNQRLDKFILALHKRNYFKKISAKQDSVFNTNFDEIKAKNPDSLFSTLKTRMQEVVLSSALSYSRSAQSQISTAKTTMKNKQGWLNRHMVEWHKKFTFSIACLLLFFIGAPLGAIIRKGGMGLPTVISILLFVIYYVIAMMGEKFGKEATSDPWFSIWFASFVFFPIGIYLTYKASKDRVLFNIDRYLQPVYKIVYRFNAFKRYKRIKKHTQ